MKNVLITGGGGFIGSSLVKALVRDGYRVTVLDNFSSGKRENLKKFGGEVIPGDIVDVDWGQFRNYEYIVHQAAITDTTYADAARMSAVNVTASKRLVRFCLAHGIALIYASSAAIYGRGKVPMKEDQRPQPLNLYAKTKLAMDRYVQELLRKNDGVRIIGLRYFNVYGPDEQFKKSAASQVWQLYRQIKSGKRQRLFTYGEQKRDFIYVKDVVEANMRAMQCDVSGVYNVGTGQARTFNEVVSILNTRLGQRKETDYFDNPYTATYQDNTQADTRKAQQMLKFKARFDLERGIKDLLYDKTATGSSSFHHQ